MLTFIARAVLLGGTFSFCDIRRTDDLPVTSGGENRKPQFSVLLSPVTFSSLKICTLILGKWTVCVSLRAVVPSCTVVTPRADPAASQGGRPPSCMNGSHSGSVLCQTVPVLFQGTITLQMDYGATSSQDHELEGQCPRINSRFRDRSVECWLGRKRGKTEEASVSPQASAQGTEASSGLEQVPQSAED